MKFYIELSNYIDIFRLQKDGNWREVGNKDILESDFVTNDQSELIKIQKVDAEINIGGKDWLLNPAKRSKNKLDTLYYFIRVSRDIIPDNPSREQLVAVIRNGNDSVSNTLILNIDGKFELRDFFKLNLTFEDPTIVFRNEAFMAENDYVGIAASEDKQHIDDIYNVSIRHWESHLEYGITNIFSDQA